MNEGLYIERRSPEDNLYYRLQQESVGRLQRLCGEVWTDYNAHDPGVTILDLVNVALVELDYRFSFPLADYLVDPQRGEIPFEAMGLLPFDELFRDSIVTAEDYEQWMTENLPGITACRATFTNGRYDFVLYPDEETTDAGALLRQAGRLYHAHRNLCETLGSVRIGEARPVERTRPVNECPERERPDSPARVIRDISTYRSIQSDFPECYGIGPRGIPPGASEENKARIRQLQAYLLIFDHLLAGAGLQAAGLASKFVLSGTLNPEPWPETGIGGAQELIDPKKRAGRPEEAESFALRQRTAWFDTLDMLYGEDTRWCFASLSDPVSALEKRAGLIRKLPYLNEIRSRSFDLTDTRSVPAIRVWAAAVSGEEAAQEQPLANLFSRYRLKLVPDSLFFRDYRSSLPGEFTFEDSGRNWNPDDLEPIAFPEANPTETDFQRLRTDWELFRHPILSESLIRFGRTAEFYRCVHLRDREGCLLVWQHPGQKKWLNLGFFPTHEALLRAAGILGAFLDYLHRKCDTFYLVEHPLLYPEMEIAGSALHHISILSPAWTDKNHRRETHEDRLRERLPAHLTADFHWLPPDQWFYLEKLYFDWRQALADSHSEKIKKTAEELRIYLKYTS